MSFNLTASSELPPLPSYQLTELPSLVPGFPDKYLTLLLPIIAYWALSMIFHYIDEFDLFPQYRLHTPAEVLKRNHVSRWDVIKDVVLQQIIQTAVGVALAFAEPTQMTGKEPYDIAVLAQRIRMAQTHIPTFLAFIGIDANALSTRVLSSAPALAGALAGGHYPWLNHMTQDGPVPSFAVWESFLASFIFWIGVPIFQFSIAIIIVDTWQYFLHRAMHQNKWLYTKFHSRHHRLYVPYAYGALYNHPFEGFLLDTCGTGIAYLVAGLTPRQSMWFFTGSTCKTVDDHCGYALPWDPLQHITSNNAGYHDVHHQSWGIKTNFSQPFFTFWDRLLGTVWTGGDVSARYERARLAAQKQFDDDASVAFEAKKSSNASTPRRTSLSMGKAAVQAAASQQQVLEDPSGGVPVLAEEAAEENRERQSLRRSPRKKEAAVSSSTSQSNSLKGLRDRVGSSGAFHGRTGSMLDLHGQ